MKCPLCGHLENKVIDSRISHQGDITRRRRECLHCSGRFTTYERVEELMPMIVKKDGRREAFVREKIFEGIKKACQKRPFTVVDIENMVRTIELSLQNMSVKEVSAQEVGSMVMNILREKDKVAYIRFASVYRDFQDVEEFFRELKNTASENAHKIYHPLDEKVL